MDNKIALKIIDIGIFNNIFKNILKKIHPNYITLIGIGSVLLLNEILNNNNYYNNQLIIHSLIWIKYFTDILDGNIARRFKKTSQLGNFLDTLADNLFIYLMIDELFKVFRIERHYHLYTFIIIISYLEYYEIRKNHDNIKNDKVFFSYIIDNTYILYVFVSLFFYFK